MPERLGGHDSKSKGSRKVNGEYVKMGEGHYAQKVMRSSVLRPYGIG